MWIDTWLGAGDWVLRLLGPTISILFVLTSEDDAKRRLAAWLAGTGLSLLVSFYLATRFARRAIHKRIRESPTFLAAALEDPTELLSMTNVSRRVLATLVTDLLNVEYTSRRQILLGQREQS